MVYNTRIAPSPTGDMHIGTARTAYFNWLAARSTGGTFLLRIDDTDLNRSDPACTQVIFDTMDWLGLDYDAFRYQSKNTSLYLHYANLACEDGKATIGDGGAIIMNPVDMPPSWKDEIAGTIPISQDDINIINQGLVLIKSDGSPTYHFASVIDDILCAINFVIRGVDHITNTSRQIAIYQAMTPIMDKWLKPRGIPCKPPLYAHIGLIHKDKKKLSKRDGAASMLWYRDNGYDPDAMLNFMARMGWGPRVDDKTANLLPKERMLELFLTGGQMRNVSSNMDTVKLDWYNRKYKAKKIKQ